MPDDPAKEKTLVPSFVQLWVVAFVGLSAKYFDAEQWGSAATCAIIAALLEYLAVRWPSAKTDVSPHSLAAKLEQIVANRALRNAIIVLLAVFAFLYILTLRSEFDTYIAPRTIKRKQAEIVRKALSTVKNREVFVKYEIHDFESGEYAGEIARALENAGWMTRMDIAREDIPGEPGMPLSGVSVAECSHVIDWNDPIHHPAHVLRDALVAADISEGGMSGSYDCTDYKMYVCVGHRPLRLGYQGDIWHKLARWIRGVHSSQ